MVEVEFFPSALVFSLDGGPVLVFEAAYLPNDTDRTKVR